MTADLIKFGEYLRELRKERGLSIRQLEKKTGVSNAYLSQIENGKKGLPSPDILKKISEPLKVGYEELMEKAGYISGDLHRETVQAIDRANSDVNGLNELINNAAEIFVSSVTNESGVLTDVFREYLLEANENLSEEEMDELINDPEITEKIFKSLTIGEKITFLNFIIKDLVDRNIDPKELYKSNAEIISEHFMPVLKVPVLGHIAAGQPIFAEDHIEEWTEIPNMWNLKPDGAIVLKVKGDSMIGSRIFDGDKVVVKIQQEVENGEIAVVNINGDEATLKRVKKTENGQVILYPDNPKYEPIFITNERARIIGKVVQVMFEPK
ncbi:transcriptional repressor LexA [Bacillus sp. OK048]|uniref:transcriptional repressor LexA n=1 Tax=Bacillus sp. OK048 TaxID=1882761 RepID=UPI0008901CA1|nr:transcriptional repressor LexA [Bacillus sp. OK048]SDM18295.1 SOS regulatory protein LexA [Bacillus sp. OK048]